MEREPFGLVTAEPTEGSPAQVAGLAIGDAIIAFGDATSLSDCQRVLLAHVGQPVDVEIIDAAGCRATKVVTPAKWDESAPTSLLGCQISNQCPADHPAVAAHRYYERRPRLSSRAGSRVSAAASRRSSHFATPSARTRRRGPWDPAPVRRGGCMARAVLLAASLGLLSLALALFGLPTLSPGASDLYRMRHLDCPAPAAAQPLAPSATLVTLAPAVWDDGTEDARLAVEFAPAAETNAEMDAQPAPVAAPLGLAPSRADIEDLLTAVIFTSGLLGVIALLGLCVGCDYRLEPCARGVASSVFFVLSIPACVALALACASCFLYRTEAEGLARYYWSCLRQVEPVTKAATEEKAWAAAAAVYQSVNLIASLLLASFLLLLGAVLSAGRIIGWDVLASNFIDAANGGMFIVGALVVAYAAALHLRAAGRPELLLPDGTPSAEVALSALGLFTLAVSGAALAGSRCRSPCLIKTYGYAQLALTLCLVKFVATVAAVDSAESLEGYWDALSWASRAVGVAALSREEVLAALSRHRLKLVLGGLALIFMQLLLLCAAQLLARVALREQDSWGAAATPQERAGLFRRNTRGGRAGGGRGAVDDDEEAASDDEEAV